MFTMDVKQQCNMLFGKTFVIKRQTKIAADDTLIFYFSLWKKIRLDVSSESSARQRINLKHLVLFSLKNNGKIFMNVLCCSLDLAL